MLKKAVALGVVAGVFATTGLAQNTPSGIPHLDHVFLIMMENHGYQQVFGNPNEPYLNSLIASGKVNLATNYFAVGHPSLTNYLEIVGGSNFGVRSDNAPDWGSTSCSPNIATKIVNADDGGIAPGPVDTGNICPISGTGTDAATPAVDTWNEVARSLCCPRRYRWSQVDSGGAHRWENNCRPARRCPHGMEIVSGEPAARFNLWRELQQRDIH